MKYISVIPSLNIMIPLAEPLLVEMSKKQENANHQCLKYTVTFISLSLFAVPMSIFIYNYSYQIVSVLLGENWITYHEILKYMGLLVTSFFLAMHCKRALMVKSKTSMVFTYEIITFLLVLLAIASNLNTSITVLVRDRVLIEIAAALLFFATTTRYYLKEKTTYFMKKIVPISLSYALLYLGTKEIHFYLDELVNDAILNLLLNTFIFTILYLMLLCCAYFCYYKGHPEGNFIRELIFQVLKKGKPSQSK
jgi:O-antigen/teichoic acid export membrane protein